MNGDHSHIALPSLRSLTCCALLFLASHSAFAFNFTVNDTADAVDNTPGDGICETGPANGICTVRAAFQESNAWPGKDSIFIPAGTYILTLSGLDNAAAVGDLDVTDTLSLRGAGASSSIIDANNVDRVIDIHDVDVEIESLTIRNGAAVGAEGGGIRSIEGALTIRNSTLSNNQTTGNGFGGGAVYNTGPLIIDNATINTNRSSRGGGVLHFDRDMTISNSNIFDNLADLGAGSGGGVFIQSDGNNLITNSTIDDNTAALGGGGGIYSVFGLTLTNSTVSNNTATQVGGAGVYDIGLGALVITNSTISGNSVGLGKGGGVHTRNSTAVITNSTIYNNYAGGITDIISGTFNGYGGGIFVRSGQSIALKNTIVSDNNSTYVAGYNCYSQTDGGAFSPILTTSEYTISDDNTCDLTGSGDQPNTDPSVTATLGFNGGATLTHTVGAASTAIDLGTNTGCPTTDQRSFPRPVNGGSSLTCDIGSVEHDPSGSLADLTVLLEETMDPAINGSNLTYNITVTNNGPDTANNVVLSDLLDAGVTYVSDTATCNTGGLPTVSCALGTLNAGASQVVSVIVTPNAPGLISNTASVSATESDPNAANNSAIETTNVSGNSDLSATIIGSVNPATANVAMTYTVTITNNGPDVATAVTPTVQFDANLDLVNAIPTVGSCSTLNPLGQVSCNLGDLANGASATISIQAIPLLQGSVTNTVYASFNGLDPNMANNSPSITTTVDASAALSITISDAPDPAFQNADIFYNFTVTNSGPSTTHNTALVVTFPPGVSLSPASGASPAGCSGAGTVTCNLGSIVGSGSRTVTLVAIASSTGLFAIDASATSNETPVAVLASEPTLVNPAPIPTPPSADLLVTMSDAADPVVVGNGITYNITATNNNGPNVAQSVIITLTLPSSTNFSSASAGCSHSGGIVSCSIGALAVGSSAAVSVTASTTVTGTFNALATVSDIVGNDPVLSNNNVRQSTRVNATGGGETAASRLNSGGGALALHESGVLLFFTMALFIRRRPRLPLAPNAD